MSRSKVLFQLTGSIACYKACQVISQLVQSGYDVQTVVTPSALNFVGEATLEGLTGHPVITTTFSSGHVMDHIELSRWADVSVVCPATAHTLNKLASGLADDLIGNLFLTKDPEKPYLVFPAMNTKMLQHPATQAAWKRLSEWGIQISQSANGTLACGETGEGKLPEPESILRQIERCLEPGKKQTGSRIVVTSGGTREFIDGVRCLTNISTGQTGAWLAEYFADIGFEVHHIRNPSSAAASNISYEHFFESASDLNKVLASVLGEQQCDAVIHLAAVSDFEVERVEQSGRSWPPDSTLKADSRQPLSVHLKQSPKIVSAIREYSLNEDIYTVAFKLTNTRDPKTQKAAISRLFSESNPDCVVHNDLQQVSRNKDKHQFSVITQDTSVFCDGVNTLAPELAYLIEKKRPQQRLNNERLFQ